MKKVWVATSFIFFLLIFCPTISLADKGLFWWNIDAQLTQSSQKAIILHNFKEEVLILGTELQAMKETEVLEFIPFPSEPEVSLAKGNPFEEAIQIEILKKRKSY